MRIDRFEEIEAWQLARGLTQSVYGLEKKSDFSKDYGLKRQIQEAIRGFINYLKKYEEQNAIKR